MEVLTATRTSVSKDMKTICSMSAQRSFIRHWKLINRSAAVVGIFLAAAMVLLGATSSSAVDPLNALVPTTVEVPLVLRHDPFDQDLVLMVPPEFQIAVVARIPGARFIMPLAIPFAALSNSMTSMARMGKFSLAGSAMPRGSRLSGYE
jgi:hypothetical protein